MQPSRPSSLGIDLPAPLREQLRLAHSDVFDSLMLARQASILHVTDDLSTREIDRAVGGNGGAWLHVVLGVALDWSHIDIDQYVQWSANLVEAGHRYLGVSGPILARAARLDGASDAAPGPLFRVLSQLIGGREADPMSHIQATIGCLRELWDDSGTIGFREAVTGHLLRQLVRGRDHDYAKMLHAVLRLSRGFPELTQYVRDWLRGHFLSFTVHEEHGGSHNH